MHTYMRTYIDESIYIKNSSSGFMRVFVVLILRFTEWIFQRNFPITIFRIRKLINKFFVNTQSEYTV